MYVENEIKDYAFEESKKIFCQGIKVPESPDGD